MDVLDPAWWSAVFDNIAVSVNQPVFWLAVMKIIWINILLSGDNAVVIALACRGLPPRQRAWGMVLGAGVAVALRIVFTLLIALLMGINYLKMIGGAALLYIAVKLLVPEAQDGESEVEAAEHLWRAVRMVAVADIIMSLDNVIAIAAAANGSTLLMVLGLAISVPLIVAGAALIMTLLERFPVLVWAGAALLGWVAGEVIATDPAVLTFVSDHFGGEAHHLVEIATAISGAVLVVVAGYVLRRARAAEA